MSIWNIYSSTNFYPNFQRKTLKEVPNQNEKFINSVVELLRAANLLDTFAVLANSQTAISYCNSHTIH